MQLSEVGGRGVVTAVHWSQGFGRLSHAQR
jgi:hypothetical protein